MEQARLDLKNYNIRVRYAKNQMLPDLQVTATYYSAGRGGDQLIFEGGSPLFGGRVVGSVSKDIWETIQDVVGNLYKNYSISLNLTVPLSFTREKAQLTQAKLNLKRALLTIKDTETTIYSEVKNVIKELEARTKLVEANKIAMDLNWQKLRAEQKKKHGRFIHKLYGNHSSEPISAVSNPGPPFPNRFQPDTGQDQPNSGSYIGCL